MHPVAPQAGRAVANRSPLREWEVSDGGGDRFRDEIFVSHSPARGRELVMPVPASVSSELLPAVASYCGENELANLLARTQAFAAGPGPQAAPRQSLGMAEFGVAATSVSAPSGKGVLEKMKDDAMS